jgi:predicted peroxiredoxin
VKSAATLASYGGDAAAKVRHMATSSLVVKATAGKNDPERCNQALTVAATAAASGVPVSLWLTGEATWLAVPGHSQEVSMPHASPVADLFATILAGGTITVCTQCAARREITEDDLLDGIRIAGAPTFLAEVLAEGAKPLIY